MGGKQTKQQRHNYYIKNKEKILLRQNTNNCLNCNKLIDKRSKRCRKCARIYLRKYVREFEIGEPIKKCLCGCGKDIIFRRYMRNNNFSNYILGHRPSPRKGKGKIYNQRNCSVCGKELNRRQLRERYNCCSDECKHKSLSKNGKINRSKQIFPLKDTKPELKLQSFLKQLNIEYYPHQYIKEIEHSYQADIFIPSLNLIIEADGDYWHNYPFGNEIDHIRTKEMKEVRFNVLRLWEHEIKVMDVITFKEKLTNKKISLQEILL